VNNLAPTKGRDRKKNHPSSVSIGKKNEHRKGSSLLRFRLWKGEGRSSNTLGGGSGGKRKKKKWGIDFARGKKKKEGAPSIIILERKKEDELEKRTKGGEGKENRSTLRFLTRSNGG